MTLIHIEVSRSRNDLLRPTFDKPTDQARNDSLPSTFDKHTYR
jgi:hypothetical protein